MHPIPLSNLSLVRQALQDFPRPDTLAVELLSGWLRQHGITDSPLLIDVVTLHYQAAPRADSHTGAADNAVITQRMNLVEALLANWQGETAAGYGGFHYGNWAGLPPAGQVILVDRLVPLSMLSNAAPYLVFNGLYRRTQPSRYAPDNCLPIRAEHFQSFLWNLHFHNSFKARLDTYWDKRQGHYQRALKIAFIAACNKQVLLNSLSGPGRQLLWEAAQLIARSNARLSMLNIYGYISTSIVQIRHASQPLVVLYLPGNASPFHEFADSSAMKRWLARQCQDVAKRDALMACFARTDWPDGLDFSGLRTALTGLGLYPKAHRLSHDHPGFATSGFWDPQYIIDFRPDKYDSTLEGDLFTHLTLLQKRRAYADADSQITSNHAVNKAKWANYLNLATNLLLPLMVVLPELAPLLVAGGLAQFSLGLDAAINGKTPEAKAQGVTDQVFGLFNALPTGTGQAVRYAEVFRTTRPGFFRSQLLDTLLNARVGAAPLLEQTALEPAELAFREPSVQASTHAAVVTTVEENLRHRFAAWLSTRQGLVNEWVQYEFATNCFIRTRDAKLISPPRWALGTEGDPALVLSSSQSRATPTHPQRMATLRALGINIELPIDYEPYNGLQRMPLPKVVSSIWVGDQPLQGEYLEALVHNAQVIRSSGYRFQILLSRQNNAAYLHNLKTLRARSESALLMPLEDQEFYQHFTLSPYYPQYRAALDGNQGQGRNFASACDILRYRLLEHYGGLYLDADDRLLAASGADGTAPLARLQLKTTRDGLLLSPPVSNDQLGMYIQFNSSMIGSHPGNPNLSAISDEILRRYQLVPDFYASRPDARLAPLPFQAYARRLNLLTGPGVLNHVIDERLPWLKQLRELCTLMVSPLYDLHATLELSELHRVIRDHVPLDQVAEMGHAHSWQGP
ncbi:dermonecrotic toxin domain-containing protein [Pseudomonas sp. HN2-3]|uniref:dermonecrotic toxin domain-containing protein n=1 Tax=Pseudomonas sp. HN2-3 TaxID=2886360 RepID=UPI001D0FE89A|nr:DUF6543 domain-containing protein [Pseudomonas sp. HN2-3]UDU79838.1 mannosyltransferase [Pseudomonas sp. HN2-3]